MFSTARLSVATESRARLLPDDVERLVNDFSASERLPWRTLFTSWVTSTDR